MQRIRAHTLAAAAGLVIAAPALAQDCPADLDGDGELTVFDFLEFQNLFGAGDPRADFDGSGDLDIFDFLAFQNAFNDGCPEDPIALELASVDLPGFPFATFPRTFDTGEALFVSLDPEAVDIPGGFVDVYIVEDKTAAEWASDPSLADARGFPQAGSFGGGASTADNQLAQGGVALLDADAGESIGVPYDVVIDVDRDGALGDGDFIDGLDGVGFWLFKDLTTAGPVATTRVNTYTASFPGIPSSRDQQRLTYPTDIASRDNVPVVIISHGNGQQYVWYDYMHDHFASHGWVVMSHENDTVPGIETASSTTLRHTDYFFGNLDTIAGGALDGRLDQSRTVWIGHSRGGEGVVRAYDRIVTGSYNPTNYDLDDILVVSSIAPTDFGVRALPGDVNYHFIYGSSDGDVRGRPGGGSKPFAIYERGTGNKQVTYIQGADHNDFNCCGFNDFQGPPATQIGRAEVQQVAKIDWLATIQHYVRDNEPALDIFERQWESMALPGVRESTVVDNEYQPVTAATRLVIDDFQTQPSTTRASSGADVSFTVSNLVEAQMRDVDGSLTWSPSDPMNGMTRVRPSSPDNPRGVVFDWSVGSPASITYGLVGGQVDVSGFESLAFRACQGTRHPETVAELGDLSFTVTLVDASGTSSSIDFGVYGGGVEEPYQRTGEGSGAGWANEFETIVLPLADFLRDGSGLDLTEIATIRFEFGAAFGSARGRVAMDDIEFRGN